MSGIYGIYRYDGAPVDTQWLERMRTAMAYYGPHGGGCKAEGSVGMGRLLLEVNPEDIFDKQPLRGERGLVVSAARLDNRPDLLETFKISPSEAAQISDGHLAGLAFDRWGEDLCAHLQGDWALAAWDARERRLVLARDAFGSANLYFYEGKGFIAFASSLKALLALPGIVKEPDRLQLAQQLVCWGHDAELTAYQGFRRLLQAHAMAVGPDGQVRRWRHWSSEGREMLAWRRNEDYVEAFLEYYTRAARSCLRTQKPVAATLSGGRDSGSVVAIAAPILAAQGRGLTAYTSVPWLSPDGAGDMRVGNEWEMAHATVAMVGAGVQHVSIEARDYGVIEGMEHLLAVHDGPGVAPSNSYWIQAIMETASRSGAGGLLVGDMGNATVSWEGNGSALQALLRGYPATAMRLFLHAEPNPWLVLKRQILKPLFNPGLRAIKRYRHPHRSPWLDYSPLNPQMALELDIDGRMQAAGHDPTFTFSPLEDVRQRYFWPGVGIGMGISSEMDAWHSICTLNPTTNLSLVEFLLRVPDDQFRRGDQGSWLFRRAFSQRLPEAVLTNQRKGLQGADLGHRIKMQLPAFRDCIASLESLPEARDLLDLPRIRRSLEELVRKVDPGTTEDADMILLPGLSVGMFLRRLMEASERGCVSLC